MGKTVILLTIISFISKVFGYVRDVVLSNVYGASYIVDAYIATLSIPDMVLDIFANTAVVAFVPIAVQKLLEGKNEINSFTSSYFKVIMTAIILFFILMQSMPGAIISAMAPGFSGDIYFLAIKFLRIISFTALFRGLTSILNAYLTSNKVFWPGSFLGIIFDIFVIFSIIASKRYDLIYLLPLGALLGTLAQFVFLLPFSCKNNLKINIKAPIITHDIKKVLLAIIPAMMSVGVLQISTIYNRALASSITEGGIAMLNNASKMSFIIENILVASIITVLYPSLVEFHIDNQNEKFDYTVENAVSKILALLIPVTGCLAVLSNEIIQIVFGHGQYTQDNVNTTSILMVLNVLGMVGIALQSFLTRVIFALNKIKLSMIISSCLLGLFLFCSFVLSKLQGLYGIGLATGISYTLGGLIYYIVVLKMREGVNFYNNILVLIKATFSTIVTMAIMLAIKKLTLSPLATIILCGLTAMLSYLCIASLIGLKDVSIKGLFNLLVRRRAHGK